MSACAQALGSSNRSSRAWAAPGPGTSTSPRSRSRSRPVPRSPGSGSSARRWAWCSVPFPMRWVSGSSAGSATSRQRRPAVARGRMFQPELEALDRERLERLVLERMRATLARLVVHPAHARRLGGAQPGDIRRPEDWRRLPFLTKETLRDAYPFGLACGQEEGYRRVHMSSGTTGNPILNPYTAADVAQWGEVMARSS